MEIKNYYKWFVVLVLSTWILTLSIFGLIKIGSNMFDTNENAPRYTGEDRLNCSYRGGTVVAENGEYKECKLPQEDSK